MHRLERSMPETPHPMMPAPILLASLLSLFALLGAPALGQPIRHPDLTPIQDPLLQRELNALVDALGWGYIVENRSMAIALVVMDTQGGYRLAMLNGNHMVYAASLPKIAILFAAMISLQEGHLELDEALEKDLNDMIRVSCNPCATRVMERVGRDRLLEILQRPEFDFYDEDFAGGLWVGKDYAGKSAFRRDPLKGLSHGATAFQVARLYYRLFMGNLLQPQYSAMMRDILARPGISHKFVKALEAREDVKEMWRKSGTWKNFHSDSVLVESTIGRYILVGLVEGRNGEQQLQTLAAEVHDLVAELPD